MQDYNKLRELLTSRKFWALIIGLLVTAGVGAFTEAEINILVNAAVLLFSAFMGSTALEGMGTKGNQEIEELKKEIKALKERV